MTTVKPDRTRWVYERVRVKDELTLHEKVLASASSIECSGAILNDLTPLRVIDRESLRLEYISSEWSRWHWLTAKAV